MKQWLCLHLSEHFWESGAAGNLSADTDVSSLYFAPDYSDRYELRAGIIVRQITFPLWKPPAHVTIDDRAITFNGMFPSLIELASFKPWNRV